MSKLLHKTEKFGTLEIDVSPDGEDWLAIEPVTGQYGHGHIRSLAVKDLDRSLEDYYATLCGHGRDRLGWSLSEHLTFLEQKAASLRSKRGRSSKSRAKGYEREVAKRIGGRRHLADTGGPEDVEHEILSVQVKSGLNVCNEILRTGMASAKAAAVGKNKLPCVVLVDRKPTRLGYYIVFELDAFADWNGLVKGEME